MGCESFDVVGFDHGSLLQGQMSIARLKSGYNSLIIGPRGLQCETSYRISRAANLQMWLNLTLGPCFTVK